MTEGDKKAWEKSFDEYDYYSPDCDVPTDEFHSEMTRAYKAGFQAGRDSKGDGWCFDMDKAPRKGRFLAYGKGGEHITTWALCNPKKDMISPHSKPFAWMYLPQPPQDRKEGS